MRRSRTAVLPGVVGVLGGMGPLATIDFLQKILTHTPSRRDQDHVPLVVTSIPQIPDRTAAFRGSGESPIDALIGCGMRLVRAGARLIVMPCNTAHLWYADLQRALQIPMLHIVDSVVQELLRKAGGCITRVGLLATTATVDSGIYVHRAREMPNSYSLSWVMPTSHEQNGLVSPAIEAVKAGHAQAATQNLIQAARALVDRGAETIVLGCTELPLALRQVDLTVALVDSTDVLARRAVEWSRAQGHPTRPS